VQGQSSAADAGGVAVIVRWMDYNAPSGNEMLQYMFNRKHCLGTVFFCKMTSLPYLKEKMSSFRNF
jgi:hypothetical protein